MLRFDAGSYDLSEDGPGGYAASDVGLRGRHAGLTTTRVSLAVGESATCTITNDDEPGTLTVTKVVADGRR